MKIQLPVLLCATVLLGGCASLQTDRSALTKVAVQAATLYISLQYPELMPEALAIVDIATGDEATRNAALEGLLDAYLAKLGEDGLSDEDRAKAAAIAAFADSVLRLSEQNPELLPWLAAYLGHLDA